LGDCWICFDSNEDFCCRHFIYVLFCNPSYRIVLEN
jgi:hypothetical protein